MKRIFLTLAILANIALLVAVVMGLNVGDATAHSPEVQSRIGTHMLIGLGALVFATLVHAISLTYFMGTGRWIEETSNAYSLEKDWHRKNQKIKYGTLPGLTLCVGMMVATGALGAIADPATPASLDGIMGMSSAEFHFLVALLTVCLNSLTNCIQWVAISRNTELVDGVLGEVHRIRTERGLPVE